ncbi:uncharacterized protein LOC141639442 [Silene latifolia]|uniref:uncharacterized protein LOC141639442 n=1 Tax=Silene latifolia TaxID=37657 RepID=UPI003D78978F
MYFAKGWYYFRFASAEDMEKIRSDTWNVNGFPLVFKPWSPTVIDELNVTHVPVWVLFPNLDPCFWSKAGLSKVASAVGQPICADEHTTHKSKLAFARILIDVDLSKELPKAIKINSPYHGTLLCKKIGHTKDRCNPGKPKAKPFYRPKPPVIPRTSSPAETSKPVSPKRTPVQKTVATNLFNRFSLLQPEGEEETSIVQEIADTASRDESNVELEIQEAHHFLLINKVDCGALLETHVKHQAIKDVSKSFPGYNLVHNNANHYNGRIWIFWKPNVLSLTVLHKSAQHMHCLLLHIASQKSIEVTFVYAFNARLDRNELWEQILGISSQISQSWLFLGDYNVVLNMDERLGSSHVQLADISEFKGCLDACSLVDHPATGCHFTWNNKQGDGLRWAKLDRVLASPLWLSTIHSTVAYLTAGVSDHSPCLVNIADMPASRKSSFKYLNCWALSPQFKDTVRARWSNQYYGSHIATLFQKIKKLRGSLKQLHTDFYTNLSARVAESKLALHHCQDQLSSSPLDLTILDKEKHLLQDYIMIKKAELQVLYQRAKVQGL